VLLAYHYFMGLTLSTGCLTANKAEGATGRITQEGVAVLALTRVFTELCKRLF
jgi:hypothetical protein